VQIQVLATGKVKERFLAEGIEEFAKRLQPYARIRITEVPENRLPGRATPAGEAQVRRREGERLLHAVRDSGIIVALHPGGEEWSSGELARRLAEWEVAGNSSCFFLIGGPLGLSEEVRERADVLLALSRMTFTHQMVRLILLEQLYRAFRIIRGHPYQK
jgi:23S rRNA (pseudouridine1915-N3)-methyltransferase